MSDVREFAPMPDPESRIPEPAPTVPRALLPIGETLEEIARSRHAGEDPVLTGIRLGNAILSAVYGPRGEKR